MSIFESSIKKQQQAVLRQLLGRADHTTFGQNHGFKTINSYPGFTNRIPPQEYNSIKSSVSRLKDGRENLYWPGRFKNFAVSAGTSGEGKHLPLSDDRLQSDRRFMRKVVFSYLRQRPNIFRLMGSHLSMPGSLERHGDLLIGEISGFSALRAPAWLRWLQVIDPHKLTELSFQQKFDLLLEKAPDADLRVITAVPSWILTLFQQVLEKTGADSIREVWPNLNLLVCGGVKLANYKPHLQQLAGIDLDFVETYGASEGYIGFSDDLQRNDLKMVADNGVFFECIPHPEPNGGASSVSETVPLWGVKTGVPYGLLLSTNAGLWRYMLNDVVEFTALNPHRFIVKGRVNDVLDEYGEALYVYEAEQALKEVVSKMAIDMSTFAIAPALENNREIPYHRWYVQFNMPVPEKQLQQIEVKIDRKLQKINRHYAIRRESQALGAPRISAITQADINRWKRRQGSASAQSKLPKVLATNTDLLHPES